MDKSRKYFVTFNLPEEGNQRLRADWEDPDVSGGTTTTVRPKRLWEQELQEQVDRDYEEREFVCPICKVTKALLPDAKACPQCGHLMSGDDCDACYGKGPVIREAIERDFESRLKRLPKLPKQ